MDKKRIVVVYTSTGSVEMMKKLFSEKMPGSEVINIIDDSLIKEVMANGKVTTGVRRRMMNYFLSAADLNPDVVVCACSSVGEVTEEADLMIDVPVVRIDKAMIEKALGNGSRIGVLASLASTLEPTEDYVKRLAAKSGKDVKVIARVATGAYEANRAGDKAKHDELITACAEEIKDDVDVIILAQGSMSRLEQPLSEKTGKMVLSSPALCVEQVKELLS